MRWDGISLKYGTSPHPEMTNHAAKEIRISTPTPFKGDRKKTMQFIADVILYLGCNQEIYDTNKKKISFALSYMKGGSAADWKLIHVQRYTNDRWPDWDGFIKEFNKTFSSIDKQGDAQIKLRNLRQTGTVNNYVSEFQLLSAHSGITEDSALIEYFIEGLNPRPDKRLV
ncbi:hypothetical protein D9758_016925 [Tetrapyrgos nigripes]|uniref:Retrotransposon gag domain-containing protein n=1 Tax=Tetrapyrgos nigripes TaxID=182062 RepID=A0A8H5CK14_9AGAR|nr:hypothetical protein D9758_016925 [Tetrapyrgos nigripes]